MDSKEMDATMARFNSGAPLPAVNPADLRVMWEIRQEPDMKAHPNAAIGFDYLVACGADPKCLQGEGFVAMSMRQLLLMSLVARGILRDYADGEKLRPAVFHAAATMPCDVKDMAEALALHHLPEVSAEEAVRLKEEMRAEGYDLDHPRIDGKFLSWMAETMKKPE